LKIKSSPEGNPLINQLRRHFANSIWIYLFFWISTFCEVGLSDKDKENKLYVTGSKNEHAGAKS